MTKKGWQASPATQEGLKACLDMSPLSWLALLPARPPRADVALTKLCVLERMLAAVVDTKLDTLLPRLATAS